MRILDFHCDTPAELWKNKASLAANDLMVDLNKAKKLDFYLQLAACFCPPTVKDCDGMAYVTDILQYLACEITENRAFSVTSRTDYLHAVACGTPAFLPTIEDARILAGDLQNADELYRMGVRFATLLWRDKSIIGGAWNTDVGLTPFGKEAVIRFLELGIIPDVSHASRASARDVAALCRQKGKPFVATHSNAFSLTPHRRNPEDREIREIAASGGVIGVNFYPPFLTQAPYATLADLAAHIRHLFHIGGEAAVVLGTDFDGVDALPDGIFSLADLPLFAEALHKNGFTSQQIDRLFFENGHRFLSENLP